MAVHNAENKAKLIRLEARRDISSGYQALRDHLPNTADPDGVRLLFTAFLDEHKYWAADHGPHSGLIRRWASDALQETSEPARVWYSLGMNEVRQVHAGGVTLEHFRIRPGDEVEVIWHESDPAALPPRDMRVHLAVQERRSPEEPGAFRALDSGSLKKTGPFHGYARRIEKPGLYRVTVASGSFFQQAYVQVGWVDLAVKDDGRAFLAWGASPGDRVPPPYALRVTGPGGFRKDTVTDADGLASLDLPRDSAFRQGIRIVLEKEGNLAFSRGTLGPAAPDRWTGFAFTDRPRYRPGDWLQMRGVVKRVADGSALADGWKGPMELEVRDARQVQVMLRLVEVDPWGNFGDSLRLPESAALGRWTLTARRPWSPRDPLAGEPIGEGAAFDVEAFRKPDFRLEAALSWRSRTGQVDLQVGGTYFSGAPVAGAPVEVRWRSEPIRHGYWTGGWHNMRFRPADPREARRGILRIDTVRLDARGRARLAIASPLPMGYHALVAELSARDLSGREVRDEARAILLKDQGALEGTMDRFRYEAGDRGWLRVASLGRDGKPIPGRVSLRIAREGHPWLDTALNLDPGGTSRLPLRLDRAGRYSGKLALARPGRDSLRGEFQFLVVRMVASGPEAALKLHLDGRAAGDSAAFQLAGRWGRSPILVTREGSALGAWRVLRAPDSRWAAGSLPMAGVSARQTRLVALYPGPLGWESDSADLAVPDSAFFLKATLEAERTWKPGGRFQGRLRLTDARGRPAKARVSVGVVDEAVFSGVGLVEDSLVSLVPEFEGNRVRTRLGEAAVDYLWGLNGMDGPPDRFRRRDPYLDHYGYWDPFTGAYRERDRKKRAKPRGGRLSLGRVPQGWSIYPAMHEDVAQVVMKLSSSAGGDLPDPPRERTNFQDRAWWAPSLATDAQGTVPIAFDLPDDLTEWRLTARGAGPGPALLDFRDLFRTRQDLSVRLVLPPRFAAGDSARITALVQNLSGAPVEAEVRLSLPDSSRVRLADSARRILTAPPGTSSVSFPVRVMAPGEAAFRADLMSGNGGDAVTLTVPIGPSGAVTSFAAGGRADSSSREAWTFRLPAGYRPGATTLGVEVHSLLTRSLLASAGNLMEYPYGCVEQTLSRFVPLVQLGRALRHAPGDRGALGRLRAYADAGLGRLEALQGPGGGWGWWGGGSRDLRMTAQVVEGLWLAKQAGLPPELAARADRLMQSGRKALESEPDSLRSDLDERVAVLHALARVSPKEKWRASVLQVDRFRSRLIAASLPWHLENLHAAGLGRQASEVVALLAARGLPASSPEDPASLGERRVEEVARTLGALLAVAPRHPQVHAIVAWLIRNRSGEGWGSTRSTATAIAALARYDETVSPSVTDGTLEIRLNGRVLDRRPAASDSSGSFAGRQDFSAGLDSLLAPGSNRLEVIFTGKGRLHYEARLRFLDESPPGEAGGLGVKRFYRRARYVKTPQGVERRTSPVGEAVKSFRQGDEVEVQLIVESAQGGEYVLVEDPFPAGMEFLDRGPEWQSRHAREWHTAHDHFESRGDRAAFFQSRLPRGRTVFTYLLKAGIPGRFTAGPTRVEQMYQPEISHRTAPALIAVERAVER